MSRQSTETYRAKGLSLIVSQYMVEAEDVSIAIDILIAVLAKMIDKGDINDTK